MAELTLLLPSAVQLRAADGSLARWWARGDRMDDAAPGRATALREAFEFTGTEIPVAALTRQRDARDAAGALWLRADPAYAVADAATARLLACGTLDLSREEIDELARALRPMFGDAGFLLEPTTAARWYLRCAPAARLPRFASPIEVLGADLLQHLPAGENERQWRMLFNEAQVILHNHLVNARRVAAGRAPANALWFWGAGRLPDWVRTRHTRVMSPDEVVLALAAMAGAEFDNALSSSALEAAAAQTGDVLLDLGAMRDVASLERDVLSLIDGAVRSGHVARLVLAFESGERVVFRRAHRWRFWRPRRLPQA
ncbi:MAG TPA: phosphoglycerate mutase [Rudaea sp.]|nr:phosphoglycerate mutase [Rudaea sp.]